MGHTITYGVVLGSTFIDCKSEDEVIDVLKRHGWSDFDPNYGVKRVYSGNKLIEEYMIL